ncbi:hypothetical protein A2U01_0088113, partial [Trifolium medium]|nr:hypothetical protein [Trifolium medium]
DARQKVPGSSENQRASSPSEDVPRLASISRI